MTRMEPDPQGRFSWIPDCGGENHFRSRGRRPLYWCRRWDFGSSISAP